MLTSTVIAYYGNKARVARALGIGKAAVSKWDMDGLVPPLRAAQLHQMTRGKLRFDPSDYKDWYRPQRSVA